MVPHARSKCSDILKSKAEKVSQKQRRLAVKPTWFSSKRLDQSHSIMEITPKPSTFFRFSSVSWFHILGLFHNSGADLLSTLILFLIREGQRDQVGILLYSVCCMEYTCRGWWGAAPRILRSPINYWLRTPPYAVYYYIYNCPTVDMSSLYLERHPGV